MNSPKKTARITGAYYLTFIVTFAFSTFVQSGQIVSGDPTATVGNPLFHIWLFRIGIVAELIAGVLFLLAAWGVYDEVR